MTPLKYQAYSGGEKTPMPINSYNINLQNRLVLPKIERAVTLSKSTTPINLHK